MRPTLSVLLVFLSISIFAQQENKKNEHHSFPEIISLAGKWHFQLDSLNRGIPDDWYSKTLTDQISLPGTTDEAKKGREKRKSELKSLTRVFPYIGAAWYQREIEIPERWDGKHLTTFHDSKELTIGMCDFAVHNGQFQVNGKTVFLRGKHDACVFPLTGYAPMDTESWLRIFRIAKSYGINHYRYHTWCPPHAAFEAADRVGIYMQPELPMWAHVAIFDDAKGEERVRNHKLGVIFECRVGSGKLLVCSCNLLEQQHYPEARQLLSSLLNYMNSPEFDPQQRMQVEVLESMFR